MPLFESLAFDQTDTQLLAAVRQYQGKDWKINDNIITLRTRLLQLQNYRCAYCQGVIELDEVGHRELDHILPKSPTSKCTEEKGRSNDFADRQHTFGYPQFTFEPYNLIITCKICNAFKKSFDPLLDRRNKALLTTYPAPAELLWFYPYKHHYSQHIERTPAWIYKGITRQGEAVIEACKLDKSIVLAIRFTGRALIRAKQAKSIRTALASMAAAVADQLYSARDAELALEQAFDISSELSSALISLWLEYFDTSSLGTLEKAELILSSILESKKTDCEAAAKAFKGHLRGTP